MNWFVSRFLGAVIAGVGWKLGSDAYESIKKQIKERNGSKTSESGEEGAGAVQTHVVDASHPPENASHPPENAEGAGQ